MNSKIRSGLAIGMAAGLILSSLGIISYAETEDYDGTGDMIFKTFIGDKFDKETDTVFVGENVKLAVLFNNFEHLSSVDNAMEWNPANTSLMTLDDDEVSFVEFDGYDSANDPNPLDEDGYSYIEDVEPQCYYQYGFGINDAFLNNKNGMVIKSLYHIPFVDTAKGQLALSWTFNENETISSEIEYLNLIFKAKKSGEFKFKLSPNVNAAIPTGINASYMDGGAKKIKVNVTELAAEILERPENPVNVKWNGYNATWEAGENRGFTVQLYKNDEKFGDAINVEQDNKSYDFTEAIKAVKESAVYKYTVVAKGGDFNSDEASSDVKEVNLQLDKPSAPVWNGTKLTWDNVVENTQTYAIQLYKDGVKFGDVILVDDPSTNKEMELAEKFTEPGAYSATVIAKASGYNDSEESDKTNTTYNTGSTIIGTYKILDGLDEGGNHPEFKQPENLSIGLFDGDKEVVKAGIENNEFTFKNVREGEYTLKITGDWILNREYKFSVKGNKNYSLSESLEIVYGDFYKDSTGSINSYDLSEIKANLNNPNGKYHFINNGESSATVEDFGVFLSFYMYQYDNTKSIVLE